MKKVFNLFTISAFCACGLFSCTEKDLIEVPIEDPDAPVNVDYESITATEFFDVPVKDGYISMVTQDGEILGYTDKPITIEILNTKGVSFARSNTLTRANAQPEVTYLLPEEGSWNQANALYGWTLYKTIMFEDLVRHSDYDYNDLIIHVQQRKNGNKLRLYIHPIAMGNHDELSLGADIFLVNSAGEGKRCAEVIFSRDVRSDLFPSALPKTFINTDFKDTFVNGNGELTQFPAYFAPPLEFTNTAFGAKWDNGSHWLEVDESELVGKTFGVNWFIINNEKNPGVKLYAVPAVRDNVKWRDNTDVGGEQAPGYPYGIISADSRHTIWPLEDGDHAGRDWLNYPQEKTNIKFVYPSFDKWLEGKNYNAQWDSPNFASAVNAIGYIRNADGTPSGMPDGSNALFDIHSCFESYTKFKGKNIWNNGNPDEANIPKVRPW